MNEQMKPGWTRQECSSQCSLKTWDLVRGKVGFKHGEVGWAGQRLPGGRGAGQML